MAVAGRPNGGAPEEGDNVEEQNYGVLEEDGLEDQLDHHTIPHLSAVVAAIENEDVDALRRALGKLCCFRLFLVLSRPFQRLRLSVSLFYDLSSAALVPFVLRVVALGEFLSSGGRKNRLGYCSFNEFL
ncbi:hypothetical protein MLD38_019569 [Melastoma candidum]|uniref:Uncharacterized protein n=1 Tax=Melastoma candidum TaxID=119954 RepID=A0ACB9QXH8_9MYRT|nr:hypothetical protein MLD38_019569 [Melastoma candidum]